ncbi:uncharacterized protein L199_003188 [Kwoniella botswanensis]|uniref:uncharacterized protein n=1 Tax=Kwoniella botswanensis TaxID=1268659 RepID=UPI00315D2447
MASLDVSIRTAALLALSQDVCALIALTVEATLSVLNFIYRSILGVMGYERTVRFDHSRSVRRESGRGCGVVVLGANEAAGQSLTLHLAKIGYTVFPLIPLPTPSSPPTSSALTHLLLTWSGVQKRLRARFPGHPGAVVPVMVDPEGISDHLHSSARGDLKRSTNSNVKEEMGEGRFSHAGETVRAYCKDNELSLVSIICINRKSKVMSEEYQGNNGSNLRRAGSNEGTREDHTDGSPVMMQRSLSAPSTSSSNSTPINVRSPPPKEGERSITTSAHTHTITTGTGTVINSKPSGPISLPTLPSISLMMTDENTMISLYRSNILDPLAIIKELSDLLSVPCTQGYSNGRIVFIDGEKANQGRIIELNDYSYSEEEEEGEGVRPEFYKNENKVVEFIYEVRERVVGIVREEMRGIGVDVCEVIVGPMAPRIGTTGYHLRHSSEDSNEGASAILGDTFRRRNPDVDVILKLPRTVRRKREAVVSSRLRLLTRLWAVDDALLFSSVRRAIEDPYVRCYHRAGISPWLEEVLEWVPLNLGYITMGWLRGLLKFGLEVEWMVEEWWIQLTK